MKINFQKFTLHRLLRDQMKSGSDSWRASPSSSDVSLDEVVDECVDIEDSDEVSEDLDEVVDPSSSSAELAEISSRPAISSSGSSTTLAFFGSPGPFPLCCWAARFLLWASPAKGTHPQEADGFLGPPRRGGAADPRGLRGSRSREPLGRPRLFTPGASSGSGAGAWTACRQVSGAVVQILVCRGLWSFLWNLRKNQGTLKKIYYDKTHFLDQCIYHNIIVSQLI